MAYPILLYFDLNKFRRQMSMWIEGDEINFS